VTNQYGFRIWFRFKSSLTSREIERQNHAWFDLLLDSLALSFGGGGQDDFEWDGVISTKNGSDVQEGDKRAVERWLQNNGAVAMFKVGDLEDINDPNGDYSALRPSK
jgi:uncharacterized protein YggL (DUF469 family)